LWWLTSLLSLRTQAATALSRRLQGLPRDACCGRGWNRKALRLLQ
jgi:hypothetical protein